MAEKKKKVLFVATVDSHIELFHLPYLKMFHDKGWEVHVATETGKKIPYCDKKIKLPIKRSPFKLISNHRAIKKLREVVKKEKYDIVHCHTPVGGVVARLACKKLRREGLRMIYTAHGFHFYTGAPVHYWMMFYPVEWYLAKYTDTLITINDEDYQRAKKRFGQRCYDVQYVPGVGVDEKKFEKKLSVKEKHALRGSLGLKDDDRVLIFPAELSKRKNQMWLIKTLEPLFKKDQKCHLLLPGKDSLNGKCQKLAKGLGLEKQIHFLGFRGDILELLQISDVAISSARQEGLPVNLIEAAMAGLPIVATDCRGNRDVCKVVGGDVVAKGDADSFVAMVGNSMEKQSDTFAPELCFCDFGVVNVGKSMDNIYETRKIAIVTSGFLPVPAVKGGATEELVDALIEENEVENKVHFVVFSVYDQDAYLASKKNVESTFIFVKPSKIFKSIDYVNYLVIDKILKRPDSRKFRFFLQRFDFFRKSSKILQKNNYDKVVLENHSLLYFTLRWRKNYLKYADRYYYHCHNVVPSKYGLEKIIKNTKKVMSVSEFRNNYAKEFFGIDKEMCGVVLNCCNSDIATSATEEDKMILRKKLGVKKEKIILYVGRIDKDKGTHELVKAFEKMAMKNVKLLIVGAPIFAVKMSNYYEKELKDMITNNPNIIVTGYVNHADLYKYYAIADVVAIPSQVEDSAPLVVIESLVCGKPIVASKCGGIPEYVGGECAILVDRGVDYVSDFARSLEIILSNISLRRSMSEASRERSKRYSQSLYYNNYLRFLGEIND